MARLDQSPLAVTCSGGIVVGLGYTHDLRTVEQLIELLRDGGLEGKVFAGVVVTGTRRQAALKRFDDAAAEISSTSGIGRRRSRPAHR